MKKCQASRVQHVNERDALAVELLHSLLLVVDHDVSLHSKYECEAPFHEEELALGRIRRVRLVINQNANRWCVIDASYHEQHWDVVQLLLAECEV